MYIRLRIEDMAFDLFSQVVLGTGPRDVPTHWKQTILLLLGDGGQSLEEDEVSFKTQSSGAILCLSGGWLAVGTSINRSN